MLIFTSSTGTIDKSQNKSISNRKNRLITTNCVCVQNGPELLPRVDMLLLLTRIIGTATPRLQVLQEATLQSGPCVLYSCTLFPLCPTLKINTLLCLPVCPPNCPPIRFSVRATFPRCWPRSVSPRCAPVPEVEMGAQWQSSLRSMSFWRPFCLPAFPYEMLH